MSVPGNMAVMNAAGGAVGPVPVMNQGPGRTHFENDMQKRLNTYIYDYLCKMEKFDLARSFQQQCEINVKSPSPGRGVNGVDDAMDTDSKDSVKRPADLPLPDMPAYSGDNSTCFLYDWWCQFWDVFMAKRSKSQGTATVAYLHQTYVSEHLCLCVFSAETNTLDSWITRTVKHYSSGFSNQAQCRDSSLRT